MTDYKRLAYKLEDTVYLGKSLPIVALRQMPRLAEQFAALPDIPQYLHGTQRALSSHIMYFVNEQQDFLDDERELKERFTRADKLDLFGPHYLKLFEASLCG